MCPLFRKILPRNEGIEVWAFVVFQDTDLSLIKCNHNDGKDIKVFQERAKLFRNKKVETVIGLQIQGPHAISKCSSVSVQIPLPYTSSLTYYWFHSPSTILD